MNFYDKTVKKPMKWNFFFIKKNTVFENKTLYHFVACINNTYLDIWCIVLCYSKYMYNTYFTYYHHLLIFLSYLHVQKKAKKYFQLNIFKSFTKNSVPKQI